MSMTEAKINYNFHENFINIDLRLITNSSGVAYVHMQLVHEDGYFGEVREFDGIANGATGLINIYSKRKITTNQIDLADTFAVGSKLYFNPTTSKLEDAVNDVTSIDVGFVTKINNGVSVEFIPYVQNNLPETIQSSSYEVAADATGSVDITGLVPLGATILYVFAESKATSSSGTLQLREETGDAAITDAMICAVDNVIVSVTTLSISVVGSNGLEVITNGAADRGIITIIWRI
jgi:hypothetical protein